MSRQNLTRNTVLNGGTLHIWKMSVLPKVTYKFNVILATILITFRDLQSIFKVYLEDSQVCETPKTNWNVSIQERVIWPVM